jgi:hypothetical protein
LENAEVFGVKETIRSGLSGASEVSLVGVSQAVGGVTGNFEGTKGVRGDG